MAERTVASDLRCEALAGVAGTTVTDGIVMARGFVHCDAWATTRRGLRGLRSVCARHSSGPVLFAWDELGDPPAGYRMRRTP